MRLLCSCVLLFLAAGCGMPSFLVRPISNSSELEATVVEPGQGFSPKRIAIIEVEGMLMNARKGGFLQAGENPVSLFTQQLDEAAKDSRVAAVVLRVNSPGGTVTASDTMYQTILRFKEKTKKPVIASAQEVAASGGYYVACAADQIVVQPTSVIGSIGVLFETFDASGTMAKIGLQSNTIKSGPLKDMGSPFRPLDADARAVMQGMVDEYYGRFVTVVTKARPVKDDPNLKVMTDGRVFSGQRAVELHLADRTGLLEDAVDLARERGQAPGAEVIMYRRPYGYGGSIYASDSTPRPQANVIQLSMPGVRDRPTGFYYLWEP